MLGFPILYFKGMRLVMFQLYGLYCRWMKRSGNTAAGFRSRVQGLTTLRVEGTAVPFLCPWFQNRASELSHPIEPLALKAPVPNNQNLSQIVTYINYYPN